MLAGQLVAALLLLSSQTHALPTQTIASHDDALVGVPPSSVVSHRQQGHELLVKRAGGGAQDEGSEDRENRDLVRYNQDPDFEDPIDLEWGTIPPAPQRWTNDEGVARDRAERRRVIAHRALEAAHIGTMAMAGHNIGSFLLSAHGHDPTHGERVALFTAGGMAATDSIRKPVLRGVGYCVGAACRTIKKAYSGGVAVEGQEGGEEADLSDVTHKQPQHGESSSSSSSSHRQEEVKEWKVKIPRRRSVEVESGDDLLTKRNVPEEVEEPFTKRAGDRRRKALVASTSRSAPDDQDADQEEQEDPSGESVDLESGASRGATRQEMMAMRQAVIDKHERYMNRAFWALKAVGISGSVNRGFNELGVPRTPYRDAGVAAASGILATDAVVDPVVRGVGRCVGAMCNGVRNAYNNYSTGPGATATPATTEEEESNDLNAPFIGEERIARPRTTRGGRQNQNDPPRRAMPPHERTL